MKYIKTILLASIIFFTSFQIASATIFMIQQGGTGTANGSITGSGTLSFTAGGSNQNVTLTPTGSGYTLLGGNIGIGTTSPGVPLEVNGQIKVGTIQTTTGIVNTNSGNTKLMLQGGQANTTGNSVYTSPTYTNTAGTNNSFAILPTYTQSGTAANTDLWINRVETTLGSGLQYLILAQAGTTGRTTKFSVDNTGQGYFAGNVGIGTTNPGQALDVNGNIRNNGQFLSVVNSNTNYDHLDMINSSTGSAAQTRINFHSSNSSGQVFYTGSAWSGAGVPANSFGFWNTNATGVIAFGTNNAEKVRIDNNGNVGIGTTSPGKLLSVGANLWQIDSSGIQWNNSAQTTYTGSISGTAKWSMPFQGSAYKKFVINYNALHDAGGTITFPTAFTNTPYCYGDPSAVTISSTTTTTFTIAVAATITGNVFCEGE